MTNVWKLAAGVPSFVFILIGVCWWVAPEFISARLGLLLQSEVGLSTQIGDLGSFFATLGVSTIVGLATNNRVWLYPSMILLGLATCGRLLAWAMHGAALTVGMIGVEIVVIAILFMAARSLGGQTE